MSSMGVLLKPLRVKKRHHSRKKKRKQTDSREQAGNVKMQAGENMFFMPPERSHDKPAAYQTGRQERSLFSFLNCATLYQIEARKAKTVIRTRNSSPGSFPFSISVMMMPATIIHAIPLQRRSLSATTLIRTKATARIAPTEPEQAETE